MDLDVVWFHSLHRFRLGQYYLIHSGNNIMRSFNKKSTLPSLPHYPHLQHLPTALKRWRIRTPHTKSWWNWWFFLLVQQKPFSPSKHLKVYNSLPMGVALDPLTFKNTFVEEKSSMTFAFRTTPLSGIRWTILHLPQEAVKNRKTRWIWRWMVMDGVQ